jgi:nucleoside-diphosphate-sugar epimerase
MSRCFPEAPELMALYRLYRGVDRRDVAEAHHLALHAGGADFGAYNISSQTPFLPDDLEELFHDAPTVVKRRCPLVSEKFARRGWLLPKSIDRVYVIEHACAKLGYTPRFNYREHLMEVD